jgi:hypothetical protein
LGTYLIFELALIIVSRLNLRIPSKFLQCLLALVLATMMMMGTCMVTMLKTSVNMLSRLLMAKQMWRMRVMALNTFRAMTRIRLLLIRGVAIVVTRNTLIRAQEPAGVFPQVTRRLAGVYPQAVLVVTCA